MRTTQELLILALVMLLLGGWLVAGRLGVGVALGLTGVGLTVYALARDVETAELGQPTGPRARSER